MLYLVRRVVTRGGQAKQFNDTEVEAFELSLGADAEQVLQLLGAEVGDAHALITGSYPMKLSTTGRHKVELNGRTVRKGKIEVGDKLSIGPNRLTFIDAPAGFDAAIELEEDPQAAKQQRLATNYQVSFDKLGFSSRVWSYLLIALVLIFGLLLPFNSQSNDPTTKGWRDHPIASDRVWLSGPLLRAHRIAEIGDNCNVCHVKPFQVVQDDACLGCHETIQDHLDWQQHDAPQLAETRCAACHKEHNEPEQMVRRDQALCVDCHVDLEAVATAHPGADEMAGAVSKFTTGQHPEFRMSMLSLSEQEDWQSWRSADIDELKESSNLKFSHLLHLDDDDVSKQNYGKSLVCADCHQMDADDEHFLPISMEKDCERCHGLSFDEDFPKRILPHGKPTQILQTLEEFYSRAYLMKKDAVPATTQQRGFFRRLFSGRATSTGCQQKPLECGRDLALKEAENQFNKQGCVTCHEKIDKAEGSRNKGLWQRWDQAKYPEVNIFKRWHILPVKINNDWYQEARFDHRVHLTQRYQQETLKCSSCHDAKTSELSSDILIPQMASCQECHADTEAQQSVVLDCVSCHDFHREHLPAMRKLGTRVTAHAQSTAAEAQP